MSGVAESARSSGFSLLEKMDKLLLFLVNADA
jgi:hypothetical protein